MLNTVYTLKHGFWIKTNETDFDLGLDGNVIMPSCSNFSYVSEKIIVVKTKKMITVFSGVPLIIEGKKKANILATFSDSNEKIFANVIINNICYTIDYNCQVTTHHLPKTICPNYN